MTTLTLNDRIRQRLVQANPIVFTLIAGLAGFCAYFSMYAFRKPFSAATFEAVEGWTFVLDYKIALVLAQVAGYALSKMIGIKVIAEMDPLRRAGAILILIGLSWLALVAFAVIPAPWNVAALFVNGLPLGMIFGLVFGFMEGRRVSEVLGAMLCSSFILSSGVVKSIGVLMMTSRHISAFWMPAAVGLVFMPLLAVSVWVLSLLPPPSAEDEAQRTTRAPMNGEERAAFLRQYAPGLILLILSYVMLTAFRDFRDNFAAEIWTALGFGKTASVFTASEVPVAVISLAALAAVMTVRDNLKALLVIHGLVVAGFILLGLSTLAFQAGLLSPLTWMILAGAGLYMGYTPFNAMLFDRLVAVSGQVATAGFLIYVADSSGYAGSVVLLLWRNFGGVTLDWLQFYIQAAYVTSIVGAVLVSAAGVYFYRRQRQLRAAAPTL